MNDDIGCIEMNEKIALLHNLEITKNQHTTDVMQQYSDNLSKTYTHTNTREIIRNVAW